MQSKNKNTNFFIGTKGEKAKKLKIIKNIEAHKLNKPTAIKTVWAC